MLALEGKSHDQENHSRFEIQEYSKLNKVKSFLSSERVGKPKNTCTFPWMLHELKIPFRKLAFAVDIDTLAMWFILSMTGALVAVWLPRVEICLLSNSGYWFSRALEIVSETISSWRTEGRELYWAKLCSLLWPETNMMWRSGTFASES